MAGLFIDPHSSRRLAKVLWMIWVFVPSISNEVLANLLSSNTRLTPISGRYQNFDGKPPLVDVAAYNANLTNATKVVLVTIASIWL